VISIEASPDTLPHLERTHAASPHRERWRIVGCAAGSEGGTATFFAAKPADGAFDGLRDTGRGGIKQTVAVNVRPLDEIWQEAGKPKVSVIKIDVEGAETEVISGARKLIAQERPALVIEWSRLNLPSYGREPEQLISLCQAIAYTAYAHPMLCEVANETVLNAAMAETETFLLAPVDSCA
jgi:FkbM family methyltransferase